MKKLLETINKLSLPATVLIASFILGGFYYASQVNKGTSSTTQQQTELQAQTAVDKQNPNAATTVNPSAVSEPAPEPQQAKQDQSQMTAVGKNYNYILISMADSWVKFNNNSINDTKTAISGVQDAINFRNQQKETFRVLVAGVLQNEQLANLFIGEFDKDIAYYNKVEAYLNNLIAIWTNHIPLADQFQTQATKKFYATEQATTQDAKTLYGEFSKDMSMYSLMSNAYSDALAYEKKRGQEYIDAMNMLRSAANASAQTSIVNNFVYSSPAPAAVMAIPTINYPTQQRCTVSPIGGGGVDLIVRCY